MVDPLTAVPVEVELPTSPTSTADTELQAGVLFFFLLVINVGTHLQ